MVRPHILFDKSDISFALILALFSTLLGYKFGVGNQVEQLPIILRQLDTGYLINDVFVNSSEVFGPRLYFARLIALLAQLIPVYGVYLVLAYLSDLLLIFVTLWAARRLFDADKLASGIAAILALGVTSFHLGEATQIRYEIFQPASLSIPLALWAVGLGLHGRAVTAAIVASVASLPHPLYGAEGGAVALGTAFFVRLIPEHTSFMHVEGIRRYVTQLAWRDAISSSVAGGAIFAGALLIFWWWPNHDVNTGVSLSTREMFAILAHFRAPHHYLPSHFPLRDFVSTGLFILVAAFAYSQWAVQVSTHRRYMVLLPVMAVALACILGVVFTEIWPSRLILTLQPFRLLSVFKWLGFILLGVLLAQYWQKKPVKYARPLLGLSLFSGGATHPAVTMAVLGLIRFKPWLWAPVKELVWVITLAVGTLGIWWVFGKLHEELYLILSLALLAAYLYKGRLQWGILLGALLLVVSVAAVKPGVIVPQFSLSANQGIDARTARAAAKHSPATAVFLAPPQFSVLRIIGQRALVVDFKSIPFQNQAMLAWRERMRDVYGDVKTGGFKAAREFAQNYQNISDEKLLLLAQKYSASHAILFADTQTRLRVTYENEKYKIVVLNQAPDSHT